MIEERTMHGKEGMVATNAANRGFFTSYEEGVTDGNSFKYLRLMDVMRTKGKNKPSRIHYRRRPITGYDQNARSVTSHLDIIPEMIDDLITVLTIWKGKLGLGEVVEVKSEGSELMELLKRVGTG